MSKLISFIKKGFTILFFRLRTQGLFTTLVWVYARGLPKITGIPLAKYSQITSQLYVGAQFRQQGKRKLTQLGINGVVNLRIEYDDATHNLTLEHYCYLPTVDDAAPTLAHLDEGVTFIQMVIKEGGKVYIHCAGGIGRAPTMAAAYLISEGYTLDEALALIKQVRAFINITPPQMARLKAFEAIKQSHNHN